MRRTEKILAITALSIATLAPAAPAQAGDLPPAFTAMLRAANSSERDTIVNVAKRLYPNARAEIDKVVDDIKDEEKARVASTRFVKGWTGQGSVGASWSAGNTDEWNANVAFDLKRKGPQWEHKFNLSADIADTNGERTTERMTAGYRARRDFAHSPWFTFGSLSYERDRFQGIERRFTETLGVGNQLFDTDTLEWEVSAGPAARQTRLKAGADEGRLALFLGTTIKFEPTDRLTLKEDAQAILDENNTSFSSTSSITNNLYGRLSGKLSFTVDVETDPPTGKKSVDAYTRVSLVLEM